MSPIEPRRDPTSPCGADQALSLTWVLSEVAGLSAQAAQEVVCDILRLDPSRWQGRMKDPRWFFSDADKSRAQSTWSAKFARRTGHELVDEAWLMYLYRLWLPTPKMVLAANLKFLFESWGDGARTQLAKALGKTKWTVSKWGRWQEEGTKVRVPPKTVLSGIRQFFQINESIDLYTEPLFLGRETLIESSLRAHGKALLDQVSGDTLERMVDRLKEDAGGDYSL